ncbi:hypothetical protein BDL97_02G179000 [Sphagnum fallax]|nr:hypothetical protein BDL97_02G179000 [Sphagnum fallax]
MNTGLGNQHLKKQATKYSVSSAIMLRFRKKLRQRQIHGWEESFEQLEYINLKSAPKARQLECCNPQHCSLATDNKRAWKKDKTADFIEQLNSESCNVL